MKTLYQLLIEIQGQNTRLESKLDKLLSHVVLLALEEGHCLSVTQSGPTKMSTISVPQSLAINILSEGKKD